MTCIIHPRIQGCVAQFLVIPKSVIMVQIIVARVVVVLLRGQRKERQDVANPEVWQLTDIVARMVKCGCHKAINVVQVVQQVGRIMNQLVSNVALEKSWMVIVVQVGQKVGHQKKRPRISDAVQQVLSMDIVVVRERLQ